MTLSTAQTVMRKAPFVAANRTPTSPAVMAAMKSGLAQLTATADNTGATRLTLVRHKAPLRLVPIPSSSIQHAGAAVAAISNYGAGLLPGDSMRVDIHAQPRTKLGVITQGANRIYKQQQGVSPTTHNCGNDHTTTSRSTLHATVGQDALCVIAPDPTVPFATSRYQQTQTVHVHARASAVLVDWFSAGRVRNGERWDMDYLSSHTTIALQQGGGDRIHSHCYKPLLVDATTLDQRRSRHNVNRNRNAFGFNLGSTSKRGEEQLMNAFATVILYGYQAIPVVKQLRFLQAQLAANFTRLRTHALDDDTIGADIQAEAVESSMFDLKSLGGRLLLGLNEVQVAADDTQQQQHDPDERQGRPGPLYVARMVASSNEDIYRILHQSLQPLTPDFGFEFYKDRIRASSSPPVMSTTTFTKVNGAVATKVLASPALLQPNPPTLTLDASSSYSSPLSSWHAYMLADSILPTGSFAHSSGIEAASQLGLLENDPVRDVLTFVQAATQSTMQQWTPWVTAGHSILCDHGNSNELEQWKQLDQRANVVMVGSAPACRASLDQGRNLLRVLIQWLQGDPPSALDLHNTHPNNEQAQRRQFYLYLFQDMEKHMVASNHHDHPSSGHLGPIFGLVGAALHLSSADVCQLLGYCVARDIVSAAVRLNLIGPMASVGVLSQARHAADEGIRTSLENCREGHEAAHSFVGGCAPVLDAIHPCHDLLAVRLFRT